MTLEETLEELARLVQQNRQVAVQGGGSKSALATPMPGALGVDMRQFSGILDYNPGEFTFTAWAGTSVAEVNAVLAEHGQYMPFDPPLAQAGATLGGSVAAGLSGAGRQRYGGIRDFILGVKLIDGRGQLVRGGGKVVKNAAGFDLPKLMVGSLGRLGILSEVSCKVFPRPRAYLSLRLPLPSLAAGIVALSKLATAFFDIDALDLLVQPLALLVRIGGPEQVLAARADRLRAFLDGGELLEGEAEAQLWRAANEFTWAPTGAALVKVPLNLHKLAAFDAALGAAARRYSSGGNLAWVAWPGDLAPLDAILQQQQLAGLAITGAATTRPRLGVQPGLAFARQIKQALDPEGRFGDLG